MFPGSKQQNPALGNLKKKKKNMLEDYQRTLQIC